MLRGMSEAESHTNSSWSGFESAVQVRMRQITVYGLADEHCRC
jgi:hypothetical protein